MKAVKTTGAMLDAKPNGNLFVTIGNFCKNVILSEDLKSAFFGKDFRMYFLHLIPPIII